ncbi:hypothetical protein REPUB_Repub06bG0063100 [Reevesia pubescens]
MGKNEYVPLFETRPVKGRIFFRLYAASILVGICFICIYRIRFFPAGVGGKVERWTWIGMFLSELWFSFYWFLSTVCRWNLVRRFPYKHSLSQRFEKEFPGIDIFVCTADPLIEPPSMVINTVLSVMAYDYPPQKLSIYLSDDGGSDLTFYAMLEAATFSKKWLPFCKKFKVEPTSPEAYFRTAFEPVVSDPVEVKEWLEVKKLYEDMRMRIETTTKLNRIPQDIRKQHKGFLEWDFVSSKRDHQTIVQILIDGRDPNAVDVEEKPLPTLVYLAREKRPQYQHHFKAGAMNALIRVSSKISNGPIILNVDCDMYSNNSESIKDSLCFFMDEEKGDEIAYVQYPQSFDNLTKNEIYGASLRVGQVEFQGLDANGGPCYIGSGCFHRREALSGKKYDKDCKIDWKRLNDGKVEESACVLEETCKVLASCTFEQNTLWGKEMGLKYGCPVEDIITGLSIQCRGWKSIFLNPERKCFLGVAPITLLQTLVQHKRWSEGHLQIFLSRYCSLLYGHKKIPLKLQLAYCHYNLWAANCLPTLYYVAVPCLCLLKGISLFPKTSSPWLLPFAYVAITHRAHSVGEFLWCGGTFQGWCNDQRIWMFKRTTSYFFAFIDTILKLLGYSKAAFVITAKIADDDVSKRYEQELIEFGSTSAMFDILATFAMLNLFSSIGAIRKVMVDADHSNVLDRFGLQILLSLVLVTINWPAYQALFFRKDNGRMPSSVACKSIIFALLVCTLAIY